MNAERPLVLSIAGFDPSAGAGILSDCKVFEMHKVIGMSICTSITFQNESKFEGLIWVDVSDVERQLNILFEKYEFDYVKIGLIKNLTDLERVVDFLVNAKTNKIIWDPILKASAGFVFHKDIDQELLVRILKKIYLVVPNLKEMELLNPGGISAAVSAKKISKYCNVFLKGGHSSSDVAEDILFTEGKSYSFSQSKIADGEKHGSGCVLSSSIVANLSLGYDLVESCRKAKKYTAGFLSSTNGLIGYQNY